MLKITDKHIEAFENSSGVLMISPFLPEGLEDCEWCVLCASCSHLSWPLRQLSTASCPPAARKGICCNHWPVGRVAHRNELPWMCIVRTNVRQAGDERGGSGAAALCDGHAPLEALRVAALVIDAGCEGPWEDAPGRRYTVTGVRGTCRAMSSFSIVESLYSTKTSKVFRAVHAQSQIEVALKCYSKSNMITLQKVQSMREIWFHSHLTHPNIISMYAAWVEGDKICLAIEYAPIGSAFRKLRRVGHLPEAVAAKYIVFKVRSSRLSHHIPSL